MHVDNLERAIINPLSEQPRLVTAPLAKETHYVEQISLSDQPQLKRGTGVTDSMPKVTKSYA
jgi:hypothetical protein